MMMATLVSLQASKAVGGSKLQGSPQGTVLFVAQVSAGGVVSTTVTVWLHVLVLPQASVASHVRVMSGGQTPLVAVPRTAMVTFVPLQVSLAAGGSKHQGETHRSEEHTSELQSQSKLLSRLLLQKTKD